MCGQLVQSSSACHFPAVFLLSPTPSLPSPPWSLSMQTKDTLTLRASSFGSKCDLPDTFCKKVANCGVVDLILSFASFKADRELKKGDGAKRQRLTGAGADRGKAP